jgi:hypothetical protein
LQDMIRGVESREWDGDALGSLVELTDDERERGKFRSMRPCDRDWSSVQEDRRERKRERVARKRAAKGAMPREQSTARLKPWEALGISRATFYRRNGETSSSPTGRETKVSPTGKSASSRETNSAPILLLDQARTSLTEPLTDPAVSASKVSGEKKRKASSAASSQPPSGGNGSAAYGTVDDEPRRKVPRKNAALASARAFGEHEGQERPVKRLRGYQKHTKVKLEFWNNPNRYAARTAARLAKELEKKQQAMVQAWSEPWSDGHGSVH